MMDLSKSLSMEEKNPFLSTIGEEEVEQDESGEEKTLHGKSPPTISTRNVSLQTSSCRSPKTLALVPRKRSASRKQDFYVSLGFFPTAVDVAYCMSNTS
jgi:hypothetical protein